MKAVILAGGYGTRLSEETTVRPKPMVSIGERPILWHIMKTYSHWGINDFIVCGGYKVSVIREYFLHYHLHSCDVTFDLAKNRVEVHNCRSEPWRVTVVDTGEGTMTGGRVRRVREHIGKETFCLTYGDGVTDLNIAASVEYHRSRGKLATVTAVQPTGRFGVLHLSEEQVAGFHEKPNGQGSWINGGYFVLEPQVLDYIDSDQTVWEQEPMERLARDGQMTAYRHTGFWQPMDTLRDKTYLDGLWNSGDAPWQVWAQERS